MTFRGTRDAHAPHGVVVRPIVRAARRAPIGGPWTGDAYLAIGLALLTFLLAACSPRLDWREVRVPDAGFQVALPDRPQHDARDVDVGGGLRLAMTQTFAGVGETLFSVGAAVLPGSACAGPTCTELLDRLADRLVRNIDGRIVSRGDAALALPAGRDLKGARVIRASGRVAGARGPRETRLAARLFVVDDRLFQVVAMGTPDALDDAALDTFFTSFRVLGR